MSCHTSVALLKTCTKSRDLERGLEVHAVLARAGFLETDLFLGSALVDMYAKCGLLSRAQEVFDYLLVRDAVIWNALISGYTTEGRSVEALKVFEQMHQNGISPTDVTYVSSLKACSCIRALEKGQQIHCKIKLLGKPQKNIVIGNALVDMYAKCGSLLKALEAFDELVVRDVVSWNTLISGYIENGHYEEALKFFDWMQHDNVDPDAVTFICCLKACGNLKALDKGQELHVEVDRKGLLNVDPAVGNALVDMYARCGFPYRAHDVVKRLPIKSTVAWNALITGYVENNHSEAGLECFKDMQRINGVFPDVATFMCTLKACGNMKTQADISEIHAEVERKGIFANDPVLGSALVDAYAKCGSLLQAQQVFNRLLQRGVVVWTALISGYLEYGHTDEAFKGLKQMQLEGFPPDAVTYICILKACGTVQDLGMGLKTHAQMDRLLTTDPFIASAVVDMYAKCGMLAKAKAAFEKFPNRDIAMWNSLITGYTVHGQDQDAILLFERMQAEGHSASNVTFISILKACINMKEVDKGEAIHAEIIRIEELNYNLSIGNTLIDMYAKFGLLTKAKEVFDMLLNRDIVSWNALLTGYVEHGYAEQAFNCFEQMQKDGVLPDRVTLVCALKACGSIGATAKGQEIHAELGRLGILEKDLFIGSNLVEMYGKCGAFHKAWEVFDQLSVQDVVSWTALIGGYTEHGFSVDALSCFELMLHSGLRPDAFAFVESLKACANLGFMERGQEIHAEIERNGLLESDFVVGNALLDMYVKNGMLTKALEVFEKFTERDEISWNSLLAGLAHLGECKNAFCVFDSMVEEGFKPGAVTFTIMLSACSRIGFFDQGQSYFGAMCKGHDITLTLELATCMVDFLCRSGDLRPVMSLIERLSLNTELPVWRAFLTSCTNMGNIELGKKAFQHTVHLDKQHATSYVFMSKLFLDSLQPRKSNR